MEIPAASRPNRAPWRSAFAVSLLAASIANTALAAPQVSETVKIDNSVYEIVFNPHNQTLYAAVTGQGEDTAGLVLLQSKDLKKIGKIDTQDITPFGLALNQKTQSLYDVDTRSGMVGVYDANINKQIAVIKNTGNESSHLRQAVVDEKNNKIYVSAVAGRAQDGKEAPKSAIWVIDGKTNKLDTVIVEPVPSAAGLAIDVDKQKLYVSDLTKNQIAEIDLNNHKVARTLNSAAKDDDAGPGNTINLEIDTKNGLLYAINQRSGGVAVIDIEKDDIVSTIKTGQGALSARLHPSSGDLYVANRGDGTVSVVDGKTHFVSAHLASGTHPQTLAIDPDSGKVYVSNKAKGKGRFAPKEAPMPYEPAGNTVTLITP